MDAFTAFRICMLLGGAVGASLILFLLAFKLFHSSRRMWRTEPVSSSHEIHFWALGFFWLSCMFPTLTIPLWIEAVNCTQERLDPTAEEIENVRSEETKIEGTTYDGE